MQKVLITGGAGFIGSRLAQSLSDTCDVSVFDSLLPQVHDGNPENLERIERANIKLLKGDVSNKRQISSAVSEIKPDIIIHLAAETGTGQSYDEPVRYADVNVMGTANLIEAVREHSAEITRRVIVAGSRSVYGEGAYRDQNGHEFLAPARTVENMSRGIFEPPAPEGANWIPIPTGHWHSVLPASIYASTKLMQEYLLKQGFEGTPTEVGILRLQNVYGPGQSLNNPYTGVLSIFCRLVMDRKNLNIFEDGNIVRDFVYIDDVVDAFKKMAISDTMPTEILDIGSGVTSSILDIAKLIVNRLDPNNETSINISGHFRPGDIRYALANISSARSQLDWEPTILPTEGVQYLADWCASQTAG